MILLYQFIGVFLTLVKRLKVKKTESKKTES